MDDELSEKIKERVERAIEERVFPGCVIGLIRANGSTEIMPFGSMIYHTESDVSENTIYDVASITKVITSSLALMLIGEGKLSLSDKVKTHLPQLQNDHGATIEDLLRYRVKGPRLSTLPFKTFEEIRTDVLESGFSGPPGDSEYTNMPSLLLGWIVKKVSGESLASHVHKKLFEPLNMTDTTFFPHDIERIAPTKIVEGQEIRGIVHDESARIFSKARRTVGHAGLFSTAPDLLAFAGALLSGKFSEVTKGAEDGLGWEVNREWMGKRRSERTFGKTGFTGTSIMIDRKRQIALVILSNRTYPHRPPDNSAINSFRRDIADFASK
jgi:CubicO group peptidase (beta-lactamase class C family)